MGQVPVPSCAESLIWLYTMTSLGASGAPPPELQPCSEPQEGVGLVYENDPGGLSSTVKVKAGGVRGKALTWEVQDSSLLIVLDIFLFI